MNKNQEFANYVRKLRDESNERLFPKGVKVKLLPWDTEDPDAIYMPMNVTCKEFLDILIEVNENFEGIK